MTWLFVALIAYLLLALAATMDKFMMSGPRSHPAVYAFFVSVLSVAALALAPFGMTFLSGQWLAISLASGITLTLGNLFLFKAVHDNDSTRVLPAIGGVTSVILVILAYSFLSERFTPMQWSAFVILILSAILISLNFYGGKKSQLKAGWNLILAALFFALSYILIKVAFSGQLFLSVFLWSRVGSAVAGLGLLLIPEYKKAILSSLRHHKLEQGKMSWPFFFGQTAGALGIFLLNYAIKLGSVTLVNALQGLQSVFLLIIIWVLESSHPEFLSEKFNRKEFGQRVVAVVFIFIGLGLLALGARTGGV